jgi:hypothetical protein
MADEHDEAPAIPAMTGEKVRAGRVTAGLSGPRKVLFPKDGIT